MDFQTKMIFIVVGIFFIAGILSWLHIKYIGVDNRFGLPYMPPVPKPKTPEVLAAELDAQAHRINHDDPRVEAAYKKYQLYRKLIKGY